MSYFEVALIWMDLSCDFDVQFVILLWTSVNPVWPSKQVPNRVPWAKSFICLAFSPSQLLKLTVSQLLWLTFFQWSVMHSLSTPWIKFEWKEAFAACVKWSLVSNMQSFSNSKATLFVPELKSIKASLPMHQSLGAGERPTLERRRIAFRRWKFCPKKTECGKTYVKAPNR